LAVHRQAVPGRYLPVLRSTSVPPSATVVTARPVTTVARYSPGGSYRSSEVPTCSLTRFHYRHATSHTPWVIRFPAHSTRGNHCWGRTIGTLPDADLGVSAPAGSTANGLTTVHPDGVSPELRVSAQFMRRVGTTHGVELPMTRVSQLRCSVENVSARKPMDIGDVCAEPSTRARVGPRFIVEVSHQVEQDEYARVLEIQEFRSEQRRRPSNHETPRRLTRFTPGVNEEGRHPPTGRASPETPGSPGVADSYQTGAGSGPSITPGHSQALGVSRCSCSVPLSGRPVPVAPRGPVRRQTPSRRRQPV